MHLKRMCRFPGTLSERRQRQSTVLQPTTIVQDRILVVVTSPIYFGTREFSGALTALFKLLIRGLISLSFTEKLCFLHPLALLSVYLTRLVRELAPVRISLEFNKLSLITFCLYLCPRLLKLTVVCLRCSSCNRISSSSSLD